MKLTPCMDELRQSWLPNITNGGLDRIIELLDKGSPLLISGAFTRSVPMGCLATHIGWHHPATKKFTTESGINWLMKVAGLNPATSKVIRTWDSQSPADWDLRNCLLEVFNEERTKRRAQLESVARKLEQILTNDSDLEPTAAGAPPL